MSSGMSSGAVGRALPITPTQPTQVPAASPDLMAAVLAARPAVHAAQQTAAAAVHVGEGSLDVSL